MFVFEPLYFSIDFLNVENVGNWHGFKDMGVKEPCIHHALLLGGFARENTLYDHWFHDLNIGRQLYGPLSYR